MDRQTLPTSARTESEQPEHEAEEQPAAASVARPSGVEGDTRGSGTSRPRWRWLGCIGRRHGPQLQQERDPEGQLGDVGVPVECRQVRVGRAARVLRNPKTNRPTGLVVRTGRLFGRCRVVPAEWVAEMGPERVRLDVDPEELGHLPEYRSDDCIVVDVSRVLWDDRELRESLSLMRVEARSGTVMLRGHVASRLYRERAESLARRVRGVRALANDLVADDDLQEAIQQALAEDPRTRACAVQARVSEGVVYLSGALSSTSSKAVVEAVAAEVPGARAIVSRLLGTDRLALPRPVILPRIGVPVFATVGELGYLEQVVMDPRSRLVTHLIVRQGGGRMPSRTGKARTEQDRELVACVVVPAELVKRVESDAVLLRVDLAGARALPRYRDQDFVVPDPAWTPPFDYRPGEVVFAAAPASS